MPAPVWIGAQARSGARIIDLALREMELSRCELGVRFTDQKRYFVSGIIGVSAAEGHDLITSPAYIFIEGSPRSRTRHLRPSSFVRSTLLPHDHGLGPALFIARAQRIIEHYCRLDAAEPLTSRTCRTLEFIVE